MMTLVQIDDHQWIDPYRVVAIREVTVGTDPVRRATEITLDVQGGPYPIKTTTPPERVVELLLEVWRAPAAA